MKKALMIALCSGALVLSGLSVAQTTGNSYQSTVIASQTQNVAQKKGKCKKSSKKSCKKHKKMKKIKSSKHHTS